MTSKVRRLIDGPAKLVDFFSENPSLTFFIRLSSISPKDAYMYMNVEDGESDDETLICRDINFLEVGVPVQSRNSNFRCRTLHTVIMSQ